MGFPRRKVIGAFQPLYWSNSFTCTLECGHEAIAHGRKKRGGTVFGPPDTCECRKCAGSMLSKADASTKGGE